MHHALLLINYASNFGITYPNNIFDNIVLGLGLLPSSCTLMLSAFPMMLLYLCLAGLVSAAGLLILWTPHVLYAALGLLGVLLSMAAIYFLQGAAFIAVAQTLVYGGGVVALLLFSTLMLPLDSPPLPRQRNRWILGGIVIVLLGSCLGALVYEAGQGLHAQALVSALPTDVVAMLGLQLVGPYALVFEWTGLNLLVALVGAVYLLKSPQGQN